MDANLFWYRAKVLRIIDASVIKIEVDLGFGCYRRPRIKLNGIIVPDIFGVDEESPEFALGMEAKTFVEKRILSKNVWVKTSKNKTYRNGKYTADVFFQDDEGKHVSIAKLLLEDELAKEIK